MIQLYLQKKQVQGFLNESLQTAFPNNVLVIKFHNEYGWSKQSLRVQLGREGRSQQSSLTFKGEWHNTAWSETSCFWQAKEVFFFTPMNFFYETMLQIFH